MQCGRRLPAEHARPAVRRPGRLRRSSRLRALRQVGLLHSTTFIVRLVLHRSRPRVFPVSAIRWPHIYAPNVHEEALSALANC